MNNPSADYIKILISLEPAFERAGELALEMRGRAATSTKSDTGIAEVDIVTEADVAVQEALLSALAATPLADCQLLAEEETPSVSKFKGTNDFRLTIDPIDGTIIYAGGGRFFSVIVGLHDATGPLYTYCRYPAARWTRRIVTGEGVRDFGETPDVPVLPGIDPSRTIAYTYGEPEVLAKDAYAELSGLGYVFRQRRTVSLEAGSTTMFYLKKVAGMYVGNPNAYDGLGGLHFARERGLTVRSTIDISRPLRQPEGWYYPGWYVALWNDVLK
jgi:fructose-1,6-bisphosphatase/inositol monophosphatase family enzyme